MNAVCAPESGGRAADAFGRLPQAPEFYPGTNRQIVARAVTPQAPAAQGRSEPEAWDAHPREYIVHGQVVEFFPIGALAKALGREAGTIRRWEAEGIIPVSLWRAPSESVHGRARLYSREIIEGMVQIALEEGVLTRGRPVGDTRFKERVYELFVRVSNAERTAGKAC